MKRNASERISSLPETRQKKLKDDLEHGKAILNSDDQLKAYIHFYGDIHEKKLRRAFAHIPDSFMSNEFSVIDWGCGQGIAELILNDFVREKHYNTAIADVTLIEPAKSCLAQAVGYLSLAIPTAEVAPINKYEHEVEMKSLVPQGRRILHILSNVVDMADFQGDSVREFLQTHEQYENVILCVSPFYSENGSGKRMTDFGHSLSNYKTVYSFSRHIEDWDEDFSCQIKIFQKRKES